MEEAPIKLESKAEEPISRAQFIEQVEAFLQKGDPGTLEQLTPQSLYQLITTEQYTPEELLFYPVFRGVNNPPNNDRRRMKVLFFLCTLLKAYQGSHEDISGEKLIKTLLQKNTDSGAKTVLHVAAQSQYGPQVIGYLLQLAEHLDITNYVNIKDHLELGLGIPPLFSAADTLQVNNLRVLLDNGADALFKHPTLGTVYDVLVQKADNPRAVAAIELLQSRSSRFKRPLTPLSPYIAALGLPAAPDKEQKYASLSEVKSSKTPILTDIIKARMLFDLACSQGTDLSIFITFLQTVYTAFTLEKHDDLLQLFLRDFDSVQSNFLYIARVGVLNIDQGEQTEIFSMAFWLMNQKRPAAALGLFKRLLNDENSIFLKDAPQMCTLLFGSAMCIAHIHQQNQPKSSPFENTPWIEGYLGSINITASLRELLTTLQKARLDKEILPPSMRRAVASLLCDFLCGQQSNLPLLQLGLIGQHHAMFVSSSSPASGSSRGGEVIPVPHGKGAILVTGRQGSWHTSPGVGYFAGSSASSSSSFSPLTPSGSMPMYSKGAKPDSALLESKRRELATQTEASSEPEDVEEGEQTEVNFSET